MLPVICGLVSLLVASCHKADYKASQLQPVDDKTKITTLFNSLHSTPQLITVTAGQYTKVRASQGTLLRFYPNSFKDKTGKTITGGTVQISITEMYGAGADIANRSVSLSGNQLLQNAGQIFITATIKGQEVFVNKYGVGFLSSGHSGLPRELYYGHNDEGDSLTRWMRVGHATGTYVGGTVLDTMAVFLIDSIGAGVDTTNILRHYNMFDSVGALYWVGCMYPQAIATGLTNVSVIPADQSFSNSNAMVFVVFPDNSAVVPLNNYNSTTHAFSLNPGYEIPLGSNIYIVTLGFANGNVYYAVQKNITLKEGMTFSPAMSAYTVNDVLNELRML